MIADYRRRTYRIAYEYGHEYELNIHEHAIRRNTVFSREFNQLEVIQRAHNRAGYIRHKLGCAVRARLQQYASLELGEFKPEQTVVLASEIYQRKYAAHRLTKARRNRRASYAPMEHGYEQRVQHHICNARSHSHGKAKFRLFGSSEERLEHVLQHERQIERQHYAAIYYAVLKHSLGRAQQYGNLRREYYAYYGKAYA